MVYAIIGAMALLLGVARFAPSDMTPAAYGAPDIGDQSASATGQIDPSAVGTLSAPPRKNTDSPYRVSYTLANGTRTIRPLTGSFSVGGDTGGLCVDYLGAQPGYAQSYSVATTNQITRDNETPTTYNEELGKKVANTWGEQIAQGDYAGIAAKSGVPNATKEAAEIATEMVGWSLQGRSIDDAQVLKRKNITGNKEQDSEMTELAKSIAKAMVKQAESNSAQSEEKAEPASVKISQGERTENSEGTVVPLSVSGDSDNGKATLKVENLPSGAKLTDASGNTVNNGDEVSIPSELKLTIPSGTDPGQAKISASTTKTSKLPGGTLLKPADNRAQWVITTQPGKDVPSNATAGINVKWDKETPSSSSSSSSSATSSTSASSSTPKPVVPTSSGSESSTTSSSRVTSTSSSTSSDKPSSSTSASESSTSASSTPVVPENHNPKISTTVDVDGKKSAEGNPVKVDASKLSEGIDVKDHIDYEGLAPNTKYEFTGTLMKVENGKAKPVSGVKPASVVESVDDSGKGTATVDFGTITDLKPDMQYVVFEKAVPVDKSENPTVKDDGTPKNPDEDNRETVTHEDADDDSQTFISGDESSTSSTAPSSSTSTSASTSAPKPVVPTSSGSESSTTSSSRVTSTSSSTSSDKPSSSTSASESSTSASSTPVVPENHNPKISTTVDVDGKKSAEGNPVKVDASKLSEGIDVKDHIDYEGLAPNTKYEFTGTLMKVENGKAKPVSGVKPASVVESVDDSGKGTATVDFGTITDLKPDMQYVVFEKAVPVDKSENPTVKDNGTPKNPDEDNRETVTHEDADDDSQTFVAGEESSTSSTSSSVTSTSSSTAPQPSTSSPTSSTTPKPVQPEIPDSATSTTSPSEAPNDNPKISTTVEVDGKKSNDVDPLMVDAQKAKDGISVKDNIDYQGMKPGTKYKFVGTLMKIEDGQPAPVSNVKPASVVETIGDSGKGTAVVDFGTLTNLKADTQYVVFEKAIPVDDNENPTVKDDGTPKNPSKDDRETVTHEDANDSAQTFVTEPDDDASSTPTTQPDNGTSTTKSPNPTPITNPSTTPSTTTPDDATPSTSTDKPNPPKETNPKISTTVDVDGKRASEGNPVQVDSAKALKGITVKDHIDYQGLEPNTTYRFIGTLMKVENGKATPVSGVEPASVIESVDDSGKGTATVDFGTLTRMKPGTKYVVFEKAVPVDEKENPTVKDDGTPKNPSKDDRETVTHEDANDSAQTFVTSPEGETVPPTSDKPGEPGAHKTPGKPVPGAPSETPDKPGQSGTTPSESSATPTTSDSPAPTTADNGKPGDSDNSGNGNNGSDNGGSDNGSNNGSNGSNGNGSGNGSNGSGAGNGSDNGSGNGSGSSSSHGVGGALASTGANVIWLALLAMVLIGAGAGVVLWNRRRSQEG